LFLKPQFMFIWHTYYLFFLMLYPEQTTVRDSHLHDHDPANFSVSPLII